MSENPNYIIEEWSQRSFYNDCPKQLKIYRDNYISPENMTKLLAELRAIKVYYRKISNISYEYVQQGFNIIIDWDWTNE